MLTLHTPRNQYVSVKAHLTPLKHGQEIHVEDLRNALETAVILKEDWLHCFNKTGEERWVEVRGTLAHLRGFTDARTLVVSCDGNGFMFHLTKEQKRANLRKIGYTPEKIEDMLAGDVDILHPLKNNCK